MTDVKGRHRAKMKQTRTLADWPNGGTSIMNRDTQPKDLAIESSCAFDGWDICGTSYAPFPLDEPKFRQRARGSRLFLWWGSRDRRSASPAQSVERPGCGSPEWIFACLSRWPTSLVGK